MSDLFYLLYKTISQFFMPLGIAMILLTAAAIFMFRGKRKLVIGLLIFSLGWLWLWSTPLWSDFIRGKLESKYAYRPAKDYPAADAIVVLGGGVRGFAKSSLPPIDLNQASDRELFGAQLYHAQKSKTVILSGGPDPIMRTGPSAMAMKEFMITLGVPASAIRIGAGSRNTVENMKEVAAMLEPVSGKSILLVTSALHMQRACWLFAKTGLKVIPAPADFEVIGIPFSVYRLCPDAEALESSSRAAREILGLWAYRFGFH
ncbi:MAG: YdcF family protein [bacterium]